MIPRLTVAIVLALGLGLGAAPHAQPRESLFALTDPRDGVKVELIPGGDVLHLVYFATWCPECVDELGPLSEFEDRWSDRGYRLVLIAVNTRQTVERLARFASTGSVPGRLLFDADGRAAKQLGVDRLPTHVVLGPDGAELVRGGGLEAVRSALEATLLERPQRKR